MRIKIILLNVLLLIFLFVLIYLYLYINYNNNYEKFNMSDVADVTTNANNANPEKIEIYDTLPISEDFTGMVATNAFNNIADIMCQNRIVKLKGTSEGNSYVNGYYWLNIPQVGPKLLYLITNEEIHSGGWILTLRATKGSDSYNITTINKFLNWTTESTTKKSFSSYILKLNINPAIRYNPELGLIRYNEDLKNSFNISSIGEKIYQSNKSYDCKFEAFNNYNIKELMIIFYKNIDEDSLNRKIGYLKIPNKDLDDISTLNNLFAKANNSNTLITSFRKDNNTDLIYNFTIHIYSIQNEISRSNQLTGTISSRSTPIASFDILVGFQGTIDARVENGVTIPRKRYIYGAGILDIENIFRSSATLIEIPDVVNSVSDLKFTPLGFELYIK